MAEDKTAVKAKAEYDYSAPVGPYNNKLDRIYSFNSVPAKAGVSKGLKHSVVVPGVDMTELAKTKAGQKVEAWLNEHYPGGDGLAGLQNAAQLQRGTRVPYVKGCTPEEAQEAFAKYDWSGARKKSNAAELKAKASAYDSLQAEMVAAGNDDAKLLAITKKMLALNK